MCSFCAWTARALLLALSFSLCLPASSAAAKSPENALGPFRIQMEKWVETRRLISEEKADWKVEEAALQATRVLFERELTDLEAEVAALQSESTRDDDRHRGLLLERVGYRRAEGALREELRAAGPRILELAARLPEPLQRKLEPLIAQIAAASADQSDEERPLGEMLMTVLGVVAQSEKWDGTATLVAQTREVEGGDRKLQVRTLYWGLAQAFYVGAGGRVVGVGRPSREGAWVFSSEPSLADSAGRLLDIYEGNVDSVEFVGLPVEVN